MAEETTKVETPQASPVEMQCGEESIVRRYFRADEKDFENDNTFQVRMSSESPAEQRATAEHERVGIAKRGEKFVEILSHEEGDVDLSRFNGENRAALLDEHNDKRHLGYIKKAALSPDKVTRAAIAFDNATKLSVSRCKQVRSGSRPNFSIGYSHTRYLGKTTLPDGRIGHRFAWQGLELSNVAVPADPTAQKGRSKNSECHCIGCGDIYGRKELNDDFMCSDCADAETPAEDAGERKADEKTVRSEEVKPAVVDLPKIAEAENPAHKYTTQRNFMADTNIAPTEAEVSAKLEPVLRSKIEDEIQTRNSKLLEKLTAEKKEIRAIADEHCKTSGSNWAGKPGEVVVVADRIRSFQIAAFEALDKGESPADVRNTFKTDCGELVRSSRAPQNMQEAANVDEVLASRCSLKRLWCEANKAFERGDRRAAFMLADGAEFEADKEMRHKAAQFPGSFGFAPEGQLFPANIRCNKTERMTRDALLSDFATVGAQVPPSYQTPIELLRNKMALAKAGITVFSGVLGSPLTFPRLTSPSTAQSLAEGTAATAYDQTFDQVKLTPKRISSTQNYSRLGMSQAPGFEAIVWDDHMQIHALRADYLGLNGSGNNDEPMGILNATGISPVLFSGSAANAYKNIIAMETAIRKANIDEAPTYITSPTARGTLRITPATLTGSTVVSGVTNGLWVGEQLVGRDAVDTNQVPNDVLLAIVGKHLLFASWAGMSVVLDTISLASSDKYKLSVNQYIDWGLRHPQAVARSIYSLATLA